MRDFALIADALAGAHARGEPVVLATVVRTEGSTYRRAGARMVLWRDGRTAGAVSGGCLEADIAARVDDLLAHGRPELVTYDTRSDDDIVWGLGLGCNGRVGVLLEPLAGDALAKAHALHAWCRDVAAPVVLASVIATADDGTGSGPRVGDKWIVTGSDSPDASHTAPGVDVVHELVTPPVSLLVCGAGADALPLVRLAASLGWRVTVADHRPAYARADRFPDARVVALEGDATAIDALDGAGCDAAVVMSHHYERDRAHVRALLAARVLYIGVLGPRRRTEHMVAELGVGGGDAARLYAPVGLDLGAETPEEIALSIVAEVQAVKARRSGAPLRERLGGIHDGMVTAAPPHPGVGAIVLAAGGSSRLGRPKQLVEHQGQPLVARAAMAALRAGAHPVVVVLGAAAGEVGAAVARLPVMTVVNPDWARGMGTSISTGLDALVARTPAVQGVLITLADQPLVDAAALRRLLAAWERTDDAIAAAEYASRPGVPALFGRAHFDALRALPPDGGAAALLRAARANVTRVAVEEAAMDVDTPHDLAKLDAQGATAAVALH